MKTKTGHNTYVIGLTEHALENGKGYTTYFSKWTKDSPPLRPCRECGQRTYATYAEAYAAGQHWNETGEILESAT